MPFDITSAVDFVPEAIPTTSFDISSAHDLNPEPEQEPSPFSSFLRSIFKNSPIEQFKTLQEEYRVITKEGEIGLEEKMAKREKDIAREGVVRQVEAPMMLAIGAMGVAAPIATAARVGAFSIADSFFNARRWIDKNAPNTNPTLKDAIEILDFAAKGALVGGGEHFGKKAILDRLKNTNAPKAMTLTPEEATAIKDIPVAAETLNLTPEHVEASVNSGIPVQVPLEKMIDLATSPEWTGIKEALIPEKPAEVKPVEPTGEVKATEGETKVAGLSKSVADEAILKGVVEKVEGLPEYDVRSSNKWAETTLALARKDRKLVEDIAFLRKPEQDGIRAQDAFKVLSEIAIAEKDIPLLNELVTNKQAADIATEYGQRIESLKRRNKESADAVEGLQDVNKTRREQAERPEVKKAIKEGVKKIKEQVKKSRPKKEDWDSFIESLAC